MVSIELVESKASPPERAQRLLDYWHSFNANGPRPTRDDFTPYALKAWLGNIDVYDAENGGEDFRLRLNGTQVVALTGEDWTGKTARDVDRRFGSTLHDELAAVCRTKQPSAQHIRIFQKQYLAAYRLLLPIFSDRRPGEVAQVFLAVFPASE
jgi:hypothetical protein